MFVTNLAPGSWLLDLRTGLAIGSRRRRDVPVTLDTERPRPPPATGSRLGTGTGTSGPLPHQLQSGRWRLHRLQRSPVGCFSCRCLRRPAGPAGSDWFQRCAGGGAHWGCRQLQLSSWRAPAAHPQLSAQLLLHPMEAAGASWSLGEGGAAGWLLMEHLRIQRSANVFLPGHGFLCKFGFTWGNTKAAARLRLQSTGSQIFQEL